MSPTLVFDMDGVLFESVHHKLQAMLAVFPADQRSRLQPIVLSLSGVPRRPKLWRVFTAAYGREPQDHEIERVLANYETAIGPLAGQTATVVKGVVSFLQSNTTQSYVASSAPKAEVVDQLTQAGLFHHFVDVFGSPTTKMEALREVHRRHPTSGVVFFGDARADLAAANSVGAAFFAVTAESNQFAGQSVTMIPDFQNMAIVQAAIRLALRESSG